MKGGGEEDVISMDLEEFEQLSIHYMSVFLVLFEEGWARISMPNQDDKPLTFEQLLKIAKKCCEKKKCKKKKCKSL